VAKHVNELFEAAAAATGSLACVPSEDVKVEVSRRPELGDLSVGCFQIAKATGKKPAEVAGAIAAGFQPNEWLVSASADGPFVNYRANRTAGFRAIIGRALSRDLLPNPGSGKTICIDYGSPNISKHLAYHHIRSTTIGHALAQIFRSLGYRVIAINHLGDWGTTHGHLIAAYKRWGVTEPLDVAQLNALYVRFSGAKQQDPAIEQEGRDWFRKLEAGDPEARTLWQRFRDVSWAEFAEVYDLLGIHYDEVRGESAYEAELPEIVKELTDKGLLV